MGNFAVSSAGLALKIFSFRRGFKSELTGLVFKLLAGIQMERSVMYFSDYLRNSLCIMLSHSLKGYNG